MKYVHRYRRPCPDICVWILISSGKPTAVSAEGYCYPIPTNSCLSLFGAYFAPAEEKRRHKDGPFTYSRMRNREICPRADMPTAAHSALQFMCVYLAAESKSQINATVWREEDSIGVTLTDLLGDTRHLSSCISCSRTLIRPPSRSLWLVDSASSA
ncbi:hypothetical protein CLAIMM_10047 [Cladophialophora immunda]|nr:hypothetical protein CLAIMM_10047 [Cladophialophora immunda]